MSFEWPRIYKWEERIESEVTDTVYEYVFEHYGVSEITEITEDQIREIENFRDHDLGEYSPFQIGFSNLINSHESEMWEMEEREDDE